jgi:hypothetical protein
LKIRNLDRPVGRDAARAGAPGPQAGNAHLSGREPVTRGSSFSGGEVQVALPRNRLIRIEDPLEEWRLASATGLAPEPIPLSLKLVLIGSPLRYYLLWAYDEDFRELVKVKVDFDDSFPRTLASEVLYARFIGSICRDTARCVATA